MRMGTYVNAAVGDEKVAAPLAVVVIAAVGFRAIIVLAAVDNVRAAAATAGTVVVYAQAVDTTGGTATLVFDAAGSDVWATGSVIESRGSSEVTFDTSAAGETKLTFTPANATTNLLTTGGQIAFICYEDATWHIATKLAAETTQTTGAFVFAA